MSDPSGYTVGWICAITTEFVAAKTMLDEVHEGPEYTATHDNNSYALGRIGKHNVAIAVLPDGEYGTTSAAAVARDMVHSFPNIRIGLMVGIGGGAPSAKHDIRLGDVVVSSPRDGKGGVFQYDFGKTIQDQKFKTTGFLDQPPPMLRAAISNLKAEHEEEGAQIDEAISSILSKKSRLRQKYQHQGIENDRLYQSQVVHPLEASSCSDYCAHQTSSFVPRQTRGDDDDSPAVHYGLVASANQLMKDAMVRDRLAQEEGVLCFEMEAAGLMNHFPCLVIRGVCDYSDSHKNKAWQGYAAMAAAAYAKQLLAKIAPNRLEAEKKVAEAIASVQVEVNAVKTQVAETNAFLQKSTTRQQHRDLQIWLLPSDPSTNYIKAREQRHTGSGSWILQHEAFFRWKSGQSSCLWLYGTSGCGKTVLSSAVIDQLCASHGESAVIYFYFDFSDKRKQMVVDFVRSLADQLADFEVGQRMLDALFTSCNHGQRQPSCEELCKLVIAIIKEIGEVWIVIDALDESTSRTGGSTTNVLAWLQEMLDVQKATVRIIVTSRPERDIESAMVGFTKLVEPIHIRGKEHELDICAYVRSQLESDLSFQRWQNAPEMQEEIESAVLREADGMFRLVACRLDMLRTCLTVGQLEEQLCQLPQDLAEVYARMLDGIRKDLLPDALRILQLLLFSPKPLSVQELAHAVAIETEPEPSWNGKKSPVDPKDIAMYCPGLTVLTQHSEKDLEPLRYSRFREKTELTLQLSHLSVKEYLCSNGLPPDFQGHFQDQAAKLALADVCISYLVQIRENLPADVIREKFPFAQYSSEHWYIYAATTRREPDRLLPKTMYLLQQDVVHYVDCLRLHRMDEPCKYGGQLDFERPAPPLYYASFSGLSSEVEILLQSSDVNMFGGYHRSALMAASLEGHDQIVEMLIANGADVNAQGGYFVNALLAASLRGHDQIVEILLANGADVNAQGGWHGNALQAASLGGHDQIVEILLANGADVNAQRGWYKNSLQAASSEGHDKIVEILLANGADVNAQGGFYGGSLQAASSEGHDKIVEMLLAKGAIPMETTKRQRRK